MEFEMINGVLVPKTVLTPIYVFIDETYLLGQTGFLQSRIAVPQDIYTELLVPLCQKLLRRLGKDAKEFQGKNIKKGNKDVYNCWESTRAQDRQENKTLIPVAVEPSSMVRLLLGEIPYENKPVRLFSNHQQLGAFLVASHRLGSEALSRALS